MSQVLQRRHVSSGCTGHTAPLHARFTRSLPRRSLLSPGAPQFRHSQSGAITPFPARRRHSPRSRLRIRPHLVAPARPEGFGSECSDMSSRVGEPVARTNSGGKDAGSFECNICLDLAQDPVVTLCGHLFCWPCLYEWFHVHAHSQECPVCKAAVEEEKLVPLYGRGDASTAPRARSVAGVQIPSRPTGQRPSTAQPPDHNQYPHQNPWFAGAGAGPGAGGAPVAGGRWGNYTFSAAIGGLFPLLSFQVHGFPQATAYGPAAGFPYGYGHSFHGWHGHGFPSHAPQGQQFDAYLKILLLLVGVIVIASLIAF